MVDTAPATPPQLPKNELRRQAPPFGLLFLLVGLVGMGLIVIRLTGPSDFMAYAQDMGVMNSLDVVNNGAWICQQDAAGMVMYKPPLHSWLAALAALPSGRLDEVTARLPSALATIGIGLALLVCGRARFGWVAGLWAGIGYFLCSFIVKQSVLIRTDSVFALTVTVAALAGFRAWQTGRGWFWFWLAAAAATLAKGPLGVLLAVFGLLAVVWERRSGQPTQLRGGHLPGVTLFVLLVCGWFFLAWLQGGAELIQHMLVGELLAHTVRGHRGALPGQHFYEPAVYFFTRFAPWSLLACVGFWRVLRQPAVDAAQRQFERFLFCWFFGGLILFSLAAHVRPDLLYPILPPAALLAGRELARWIERANWNWSKTVSAGAAAAVVGLGAIGWYYHSVRSNNSFASLLTRHVKESAAWVRSRGGDQFPLTYVDRTFALQFYLGTMRVQTTYDQAAELLKGPDAVFIAARDVSPLKKALGENAPPLFEVKRCPAEGELYFSIVSNRPRLEWSDRMAAGFGPFVVRMERARLLKTRGHEFVFDSGGAVTISNVSGTAQTARVRWAAPGSPTVREKLLQPGESWRTELAASAPPAPG